MTPNIGRIKALLEEKNPQNPYWLNLTTFLKGNSRVAIKTLLNNPIWTDEQHQTLWFHTAAAYRKKPSLAAWMTLSKEERADHILRLFVPWSSERGWAYAWKDASDAAKSKTLLNDNHYSSEWLRDYKSWTPTTAEGHCSKLNVGLYGLQEISWPEEDALSLFSSIRKEASVFHTEPFPQSLKQTAYLWASMAKYPQLVEDMPTLHPWFNALLAATELAEYRAPFHSDEIQRLTTPFPSYDNAQNPLDVPLAAAIRQRETGTPFSAPSEVTAILETWDVLGGVDNDLIAFIGSLPIGSNESLAMPALDYASSNIEFA